MSDMIGGPYCGYTNLYPAQQRQLSDLKAQLAAAQARVAELGAEKKMALSLMETDRQEINEVHARNKWCEQSLQEEIRVCNERAEQLRLLREAVDGVIAGADMPTADDKPEEVIANFRAFVAAIERLKIARGK
jgi:septal ring factor EnvC (AmiA/AmiB activator)